jgi:carbamoyl-phosphate synthase large subunit
VHSGDSACSLPTQTIPTTTLNTIRDWTFKVAKALNVVGLINIQYAIQVRGQALLNTLSPCYADCYLP